MVTREHMIGDLQLKKRHFHYNQEQLSLLSNRSIVDPGIGWPEASW